MLNFRILPLVFFVCALSSCEKEDRTPRDPAPAISEVPEISLGSIPVNYNEFDNVALEVHYLDGDGDIGFENADSSVVLVTDSRGDIEFKFHVPPLAPEGEEVAIQGVLNIVVENVILLNGSGNAETTTFTVKLVDRAGNWSNVVTTPTLTINP